LEGGGVTERKLYSIGDLARRTGLSVRTIRFYSDVGLLPPAGRSAANHRRYDLAAVARLDLVRTLRELGFDLSAVQRVVAGEVGVAEAAAAHGPVFGWLVPALRRHQGT
jgi:DNA-binding transcriptional MerR regulator